MTLTPFPDGEGFFEHAWNGLSYPQKAALSNRTASLRLPHRTWDVLRRRQLIEGPDYDTRRTARGQALFDWALRTGKISEEWTP